MDLLSFLDEQGIRYRLSRHPDAYTAQDLAHHEHVPGDRVIKPVVVRADGQFFMCALPATYRIDLDELRTQLDAERVEVADEAMLSELFPDCELGAEPPIGRFYGIPTVMDESLLFGDHVTFQAGTHRDSVTMTLAEYRRIAQPEVAHFGRHV